MTTDMPEWKTTTVGELIESTGGEIKTGPFGTTLKASEYSSDGIGVPLISVREINYGHVELHSKTPRVPTKVQTRLPEYILRTGDILFARKGAVDRSALVTPDQEGWFLGSDGIRLRLSSEVNAQFIGYQLQSKPIREWILQHATGTTMPSLNQRVVSRIPIQLPPLPYQRAVSCVLGALDDKIKLNREMNRTLEATSQAIFRSWFVDFDPVVANADGRKPFGMTDDLAALFPDAFVKSKLGPIPEGWTISNIGKSVSAVGGSTPSTKEPAFWEGGEVNWATPKDLSGQSNAVLLETRRKITEAGLEKISSGLLPCGTVLMSSRAPVGYLAIADVPLAINQGFIGMRCETLPGKYYVLHWAQEEMDQIKARAGGTTFAEISKRSFRPIPILIPDQSVHDAWHETADALHSRVVHNVRESNTLAALRDLLLPKLLSGEIRVAEAERELEEAGV